MYVVVLQKMRQKSVYFICGQHFIQNISDSFFYDNIFIESENIDNMANSKDKVDNFFDQLDKI